MIDGLPGTVHFLSPLFSPALAQLMSRFQVVIETQVSDTHDAQAQASEVRGACQTEG